MRVIAQWPDPRDPSHIIDQSRDCGGGPFGDLDPFIISDHGGRGAVNVSQSIQPVPYGLGVIYSGGRAKPKRVKS